MRIGITGHTNLVPECVDAVHAAIRAVLVEEAGGSSLIGVTCLAPGADQFGNGRLSGCERQFADHMNALQTMNAVDPDSRNDKRSLTGGKRIRICAVRPGLVERSLRSGDLIAHNIVIG